MWDVAQILLYEHEANAAAAYARSAGPPLKLKTGPDPTSSVHPNRLCTTTKDVLNDVNKHISRSCIRWASRHSTWWLPNKWHVALSPDSNADASSTLHSSGFRGKSYIALLGLMRPREPLT